MDEKPRIRRQTSDQSTPKLPPKTLDHRPDTEDSEVYKNKLSPSEFARNVLLECNVMKKPLVRSSRPTLAGGNSIMSQSKQDRDLIQASPFRNRRVSEGGAILPAPRVVESRVQTLEPTRSALKMPKRDVNQQIERIMLDQRDKLAARHLMGPPYLPGEAERRAQWVQGGSKGRMFATHASFWSRPEKELYHY